VVAAPASASPQPAKTSRHGHGNRGSTGSGAEAYAVLKTRSIFVKGDQRIASDPVPGPRGVDNGLRGKSGSTLVFNGVIFFGDEANAMIEDMGSNTVSLVHAGDLIAAGTVSAISFDDLTYEANAQQRHVSLGQNMDGVIPSPVAPTTMPAGATPTVDAAGAPAPGATTPPAPGAGGSAEDILARMKAKRNQELGIK